MQSQSLQYQSCCKENTDGIDVVGCTGTFHVVPTTELGLVRARWHLPKGNSISNWTDKGASSAKYSSQKMSSAIIFFFFGGAAQAPRPHPSL